MVINSLPNNKEIKRGLYLVSTPIGNLNDITLRSLDILKKSHYILCEDIRVSSVLLKKHGIKSKLISNHKFNETKNLYKIINLLQTGSIISLISDAGTPGVSDPGAILVNECVKNGIDVIPLPGPSSITSAISISGFSDKFFFYGFFPEKKKLIDQDLKNLSKINSSIIFFISPKKINKIIPYLKKNFSGRSIIICREMTKLFEEFIRTEVDSIVPFKVEPKGELTVVISQQKLNKKISQKLDESDKILIKTLIKKLSVKEITSLINKDKKIPKKTIYNYCLELKNEN